MRSGRATAATAIRAIIFFTRLNRITSLFVTLFTPRAICAPNFSTNKPVRALAPQSLRREQRPYLRHLPVFQPARLHFLEIVEDGRLPELAALLHRLALIAEI